MNREISAVELKSLILGRCEHAILDVREQGIYFDGHLLWATNLPLSRLELEVHALLPRRTVSITVYDSGSVGQEIVARRAQNRLQELGYTHVAILTGGVKAWQSAGFELFTGLNVPSKTFGEYLLQNCQPPEIRARDLHARLQQRDQVVILDSRPLDEYRAMSVPGAINVPGAELVYRVFDIAPDPQTDIVVNCAGRTRSIVGAQSLINAAIDNQVMLLKDGTMGWHLAGLTLEHDQCRVAPEPSPVSYRKACTAAKRVAEKFAVASIDHATLSDWRADDTRTLYLFDVRTAEEFGRGHLPDSHHAPGGQLVQTTDEFVAVHHARIVLIDDREVRATMTASWLMQMGHRHVYVLDQPFVGVALETGPAPHRILGYEEYESVTPGELKAALQSGEPMMLVDLSLSRNFRAAHIDSAHWCIRQRLEASLALHQPIGLLVLTSEDGVLAHLAAGDLMQSAPRQLVRVLQGGNQAWRSAGYPLTAGQEPRLTEMDDIWERPYDHELGQEQRMKNYLEWEVQLLAQAQRDGTIDFRC